MTELWKEEKKELSALATLKNDINKLYEDIGQLRYFRYTKLLHGLNAINTRLQVMFQYFVERGECYLNFSSDSVLLFEEGVSVNAKFYFRDMCRGDSNMANAYLEVVVMNLVMNI